MNYTYNYLPHRFTVEELDCQAHFDVEFNVTPEGEVELIDHTLVHMEPFGDELIVEAHCSFVFAHFAGAFNEILLDAALKWGYEPDEETPPTD